MREKLKITKSKWFSLVLVFTLVFTGVFGMISYGSYAEEGKGSKAAEDKEIPIEGNASALSKPVNIPGVTWGVSDIGNPRVEVAVLEVVPYKGMGQIGYTVGGSEPFREWKTILESLDTIEQKRDYYQQLCSQINSVAGKAIKLPPNYNTPQKLVRTASEMAADISNGGVNLKEWVFVDKPKDIVKSNKIYKLEKVDVGKGEYSRTEIFDSSGNLKKFDYTIDNKTGDYKVQGGEQGVADNVNIQLTSDKFNAAVSEIQVDHSYYYYDGLQNEEWFKKHTLRLEDKDLANTEVRVYTVTPEELNNNNKILEDVDLVYFSAGKETAVQNTGNVPLYEHLCTVEDAKAYVNGYNEGFYTIAKNKSFQLKSGLSYPSYKGENDLNWSTAKEVFLKTAIQTSISVVFNSQIYNDGTTIKSDGNVFKLYIMLHLNDKIKFYDDYLKDNTDGKYNGKSVWDSLLLSSWLSGGADAMLGNAHHVVDNIYVMDGSENFGRVFITDDKGNGSDKYFDSVRDYLAQKYNEHKNQVSTADILAYLLAYLQGKPPVVKFSGSEVFPSGVDKYFMYVYNDVDGTEALEKVMYEVYDKTTFDKEMKVTFEYKTTHSSCSKCGEVETELRNSINSMGGRAGVTAKAGSDPMYITIDDFNLRKDSNHTFSDDIGCPLKYFDSGHNGVQKLEYIVTAEKVVNGIVRSHKAELTVMPITLFNLD